MSLAAGGQAGTAGIPVRRQSDRAVLHTHPDLGAAIDAARLERAVHQFNPDPAHHAGRKPLRLVIGDPAGGELVFTDTDTGPAGV